MKTLTTITFAAAFAMACATTGSHGPMAMATLAPTSNQTAKGTVHFTEAGGGAVEVDIDLTNVTPGVHGFHIHDKGDCSDDAKAAGPHFNPTATQHGAPTAPQHHAGDFGNVTADASGNVKTHFTTHSITVGPGGNSVVGHAVVLHGGPDDLTTQPAGNSGPRIACGVTEVMNGNMQH